MDRSRNHVLFWCLLGTQGLASHVLIWAWAPTYQRLISHGALATTPRQFEVSLAVVAVMQAAYWPAHALKQGLHFRSNPVLGHVLITVGEFSLFFVAAMATVVLFDHFRDPERLMWKLGVLALALFAVSCYKYQLTSLGEKLIDRGPGAAAEC
jgi:hypothetical protein